MSMSIQPYYPIPVTLTSLIETYKTEIQESVSKHDPTYVFREYYVCHRSGSESEHGGVVRVGTSVPASGL
ncbi:uncharacterized protein EV154DRAFT_564603 [Mucor mucedo]|uniref:uncharacterized protein n=1 Tax=Mucor mucedo TaxID=29922 RepID=UPI002220E878|nr:uncharacterized protein EV154DRAFT_564603 [Mucor mucedo]KAI7890122.1 hypothetical protein EV154DRAFT_564603 [Mucor mucedo]